MPTPLLPAGRSPAAPQRRDPAGGCSSAPAAKFCWRRRLFPTLRLPGAGSLSGGHRGQRPVREPPGQGRSCRKKRTMCSAPPTGQTSSRSCCNTPTTSCSTRPASWQSSARQQRRRAKASACASTRSAPRRRVMPFTTPAPRQPSGHHPCPVGRRRGSHPELPALLDGLHFHTLCEQDADALAVTLAAVESKVCGPAAQDEVAQLWRGGTISPARVTPLPRWKAASPRCGRKYGVQVYLEPGEAWALNAGLSGHHRAGHLQNGDTSLAILDMSAACHTPDVIEMPYRPPLLDAGDGRKGAHRPAGRPHLPCRGYHRGLQLWRPPRRGR